MKSNRQRRAEIKSKRAKRAMKLKTLRHPRQQFGEAPLGSLPADHSALSHNNTYGVLSDYYVDQGFSCRDCGATEVWTAPQQKWWYEVAKGHIDSRAVRCGSCRKRIRNRKTAQKRHMEAMKALPRHANEAFFRRRMRCSAG